MSTLISKLAIAAAGLSAVVVVAYVQAQEPVPRAPTLAAADQAARGAVWSQWSNNEHAWVRCSDEGGRCSFAGTRQVRFGSEGAWAYRVVADGIGCDAADFGSGHSAALRACWVR